MSRGRQQQDGDRTRFLDLGEEASVHDRQASAMGAQGGSPDALQDAAGMRARSRRARSQHSSTSDAGDAWYRPTLGKVLIMAVAIAFIVFAANLCSTASSIDVTVNGTNYTLRGEKTLQVALKESGLPINPGDLISLQGNVLQRSSGYPFSATVNDEETVDPDFKLHDGDIVVLTDGKDKVEPYDAVEATLPYGASIVGLGAIHTFTPGVEGVMETRTGQLSGEVVQKQTVDPVDVIETRYDPDVGTRKIVALTFDDGPSLEYTQSILDILASSDAKATFFCRGDAIVGEGVEIVKRASEAGHQICTHSFDNGASVNGEMSQLTPDEIVDQITRGYQSLQDALGVEPSHKVRVGGEDMSERAIVALAPMIDAEIGWTLDTGDWVYMDEDSIYDVLMSVKAGDVVRLHDGGGDQEPTVNALKRALPKLARRGFEFVTIDQMLGEEAA